MNFPTMSSSREPTTERNRKPCSLMSATDLAHDDVDDDDDDDDDDDNDDDENDDDDDNNYDDDDSDDDDDEEEDDDNDDDDDDFNDESCKFKSQISFNFSITGSDSASPNVTGREKRRRRIERVARHV